MLKGETSKWAECRANWNSKYGRNDGPEQPSLCDGRWLWAMKLRGTSAVGTCDDKKLDWAWSALKSNGMLKWNLWKLLLGVHNFWFNVVLSVPERDFIFNTLLLLYICCYQQCILLHLLGLWEINCCKIRGYWSKKK